mmetsp:Transcript_15949/g.29474  ORF Transcript_15949/g.29474 Transcript_15949/m.29474 type:complete len:237 (-) Transcript_15949:610-1320(-)
MALIRTSLWSMSSVRKGTGSCDFWVHIQQAARLLAFCSPRAFGSKPNSLIEMIHQWATYDCAWRRAIVYRTSRASTRLSGARTSLPRGHHRKAAGLQNLVHLPAVRSCQWWLSAQDGSQRKRRCIFGNAGRTRKRCDTSLCLDWASSMRRMKMARRRTACETFSLHSASRWSVLRSCGSGDSFPPRGHCRARSIGVLRTSWFPGSLPQLRLHRVETRAMANYSTSLSAGAPRSPSV